MKLIILNKKTLYLILIVLVLVFVCLFLFIKLNMTKDVFQEDIYYQGTKDEKVVAFACNIDWGLEYIDDMLDIFHENNIKITFFPTGKWAENNSSVIKDIFRKGHEIGNHGYNHLDYDKLNLEQNKEEILKSHKILKEIIEEDPIYFALPSGAFNDYTIEASKALNYKLILWSIDTIDWRNDSHKELIKTRVIDKIHNSAIVLMHPTEETVKALPDIIDFLLENDYKVGTISDVL